MRGAALDRRIKGGADVKFLVWPARAAQLERDGLIIKTQDGGELRAQVETVQHGQLDETYDVVLLCCKATILAGPRTHCWRRLFLISGVRNRHDKTWSQQPWLSP